MLATYSTLFDGVTWVSIVFKNPFDKELRIPNETASLSSCLIHISYVHLWLERLPFANIESVIQM